jgi:sterol desaturase/sphingolipid hydroxylase (fatty acid hydroxylase superfamily)
MPKLGGPIGLEGQLIADFVAGGIQMRDQQQDSHFVDAYGVDLRLPLFPQVAALGDRYFDWVHTPIRKATIRELTAWDQGRWPGSVRIFAAPWLEVMTHISWKLVLAVWVPVIVGLLVAARTVTGVGWQPLAGIWAGGVLLWTLIEYVLHRFFFHTAPRTSAGIKAHFLAHGIHHFDPFDATRLVFPPLGGLGIALCIFLLLDIFMSTGASMALMAGVLTGYLVYDISHYISHHGIIRDPWFRYLHRYHKAHHHRDPDALFGVSNPLWDVVFRTGSEKF